MAKAAKKTVKKASGKVNKSQAIRDYDKANPGQGPTAIAKALSAKGIDVSPPQVSNVLSAAGKKKTKKRKPGPKPGPKPGRKAAAATGKVSVDSLVDAKNFAEKVGGVDAAKELLTTLKKISG
ncbi:MAG: hypothetical protein AAGJ46_00020 [Planctomycetota bacterium]